MLLPVGLAYLGSISVVLVCHHLADDNGNAPGKMAASAVNGMTFFGSLRFRDISGGRVSSYSWVQTKLVGTLTSRYKSPAIIDLICKVSDIYFY